MDNVSREDDVSKRGTMDSEDTHWRQLCPSIFDIEAEHGISKDLLHDVESIADLYFLRQKLPQGKHRRRGKREVLGRG